MTLEGEGFGESDGVPATPWMCLFTAQKAGAGSCLGMVLNTSCGHTWCNSRSVTSAATYYVEEAQGLVTAQYKWQ